MLVLNAITSMKTKNTEEEFGTSFLNSGSVDKLFTNASFIRELETPYGRPDVVLFDTRPDSRRSIMAAMRMSPSTTAFSSVLFTLKESGARLDMAEIVRTTNLSQSSVRSVVKAMKEQGLISVNKLGIGLTKKALIPQTTIVSIEFKLHDWRKALQQAVRHLTFADKAYVIMPQEKKRLLMENIDLFTSFGVSVAVYDVLSQELEEITSLSQDNHLEVPRIDLVSRIWVNRELIGQV